ncbi:MAG: YkgJ family cysteine cluster protein [Mariniphaga sp.]
MSNVNQNICIYCGFCCDGTLFNHARIKENEQIATNFSFEIIEKEKRSFKQPCPYYINNICVIYAERPYAVCESFQCKLLKALGTGIISFDGAMKNIDDVTGLKTKIENQLFKYHPENKGDSLTAKMKEFNSHFKGTMSEAEFRKKYGKMVLDYFILNEILDNKFKSKPL